MSTIKQNSSMIVVLWGLIFSKCLTLEYLIQSYSLPINSFFYIWLLTISMASVATVVFFRILKKQSCQPKKISVVQLVWFACGTASLLSVGAFYLADGLRAHVLVTVISAILGIGYFVHGIIIRKCIHILSGIGWWIGSAMLVTQNDLECLAIFAFLIIMLTILPLMIEMRQQKTGFF